MPNAQCQFLEAELNACRTYVELARSMPSEELRGQALTNAMHAHTTVQTLMETVRLAEPERVRLEKGLRQLGNELLGLLGV